MCAKDQVYAVAFGGGPAREALVYPVDQSLNVFRGGIIAFDILELDLVLTAEHFQRSLHPFMV